MPLLPAAALATAIFYYFARLAEVEGGGRGGGAGVKDLPGPWTPQTAVLYF